MEIRFIKDSESRVLIVLDNTTQDDITAIQKIVGDITGIMLGVKNAQKPQKIEVSNVKEVEVPETSTLETKVADTVDNDIADVDIPLNVLNTECDNTVSPEINIPAEHFSNEATTETDIPTEGSQTEGDAPSSDVDDVVINFGQKYKGKKISEILRENGGLGYFVFLYDKHNAFLNNENNKRILMHQLSVTQDIEKMPVQEAKKLFGLVCGLSDVKATETATALGYNTVDDLKATENVADIVAAVEILFATN